MRRYLIERNIPEVGSLPPDQMCEMAKRSNMRWRNTRTQPKRRVAVGSKIRQLDNLPFIGVTPHPVG